MNDLADAFESENPDIGVQISYVDRPAVESAVKKDKPAVAVNEASLMSDLGATEGDPADLGSDPMQIVVPTGNPANVQDVTVFGDTEVMTGICADPLPCGIGAEEVFTAAGLAASADQVFDTGAELLAQIRKKDLDAGLLRRSQGAGADNPKWEIVTLPDDINAATDYQVALVASSSEAETFVTWLTESETAQEILASHGLREPSAVPDSTTTTLAGSPTTLPE
jgi:molybdate transport system substrate-binding protein